MRLRQVPTAQQDIDFLSLLSPQRKDAGDERKLTDGDTVNEIFPSPIDGVANREGVASRFRHGEKQNRVGVELVVIVVSDFIAVFVIEGRNRLEPPRHGIRQVGNDPSCRYIDNEQIILFRLKPEVVDIAGADLSIDDGRHRNSL